jgi:uncharacterized protein (TIGR03663 family)
MNSNRSSRWLEWVLLALVLVLALWLRLADVAARPMHADEANQAVKLGGLLAGEGYRFDPSDHHGPTLYYFSEVVARWRGENNLAALTEFTVRLTPVLAGVLAVLLLWILVRPLGRWPALLAALLLAVAPAAVYYSRYFIQETLLVTFTLGAFVCGRAWWEKRGLIWAVGTGGWLGLMLATKASALVLVAAACLALAACRRTSRTPWREVAVVGVVAAFVAAAFYSSFGTNLGGLRDALVTPFAMLGRVAGGESGHEKPWWYYLRLFVYQKQGGYVWDESVLLLPALVGAGLGWRRGGLSRFVAVYVAVIALVYSLAPYKTPWQVVNLVPGLCILAAITLASVRRWVAVPLVLVVLAGLGWQTRQAVFLRPADERNPFAYVHTVPDMVKVPAIAAAVPAGPVKVIGREYWPLPWYLRARPAVGFWTEPPTDCDGVLVFVEADQAEAVRARLKGNYTESFLGLRPGVLVVVFTRVGA